MFEKNSFSWVIWITLLYKTQNTVKFGATPDEKLTSLGFTQQGYPDNLLPNHNLRVDSSYNLG